ncbi:MAG: putative colanic acid biosynthesis acetyltransferase [Chitinophagaceae bacterium]|nr:putative colanic acid biosynthesis acetyltransferase [Chitinophagaceae bacterium]
MKLTTDLSSYDNGWYKKEIGASRIKQFCWYFVNVLFFINPLNPSTGLKRWLLKLFGAKLGKGIVIKPGVNIKYPWKLSVGDHSWIGEKVWIDNLAAIHIGANACISQGAMLLTGNHDYSKSGFDLIVKPITLEEGVWIGAQALVCPGVYCKSHAVLSAKSVATKDLEAFTIYQGNPAIAVRERMINS